MDSANHALLLTSTGNGINPVVASANTLTDTTHGAAVAVDNANAGYQAGTPGSPATYSTAVLQLTNGGAINDATATLTGQIEIQNGAGFPYTFVMGVGVDNPGTQTYYTGSSSVSSLVDEIGSVAALGVTATAPGGGTGGIYLQATTAGAAHLITTPGVTTLASAVAENASASVGGVTPVAGNVSTLSVLASGGSVSTSDLLAAGGTITFTNGGITNTFVIGAGTDNTPAGTSTPLIPEMAATRLPNLATTISARYCSGVTAQANTAGLALTSTAFEGNSGIVLNSNTLADATEGSYSGDHLGLIRQ